MEATRAYQCPQCDCGLYILLISQESRQVVGVECGMCGKRQSLDEINGTLTAH
jgi:transcription elongation factor Elf1